LAQASVAPRRGSPRAGERAPLGARRPPIGRRSMKRQFESGKGDDDGPPRQRRRGGRSAVDMPCVLKFLCPEALASAVIGKGGAAIKQIREQTGAKLGLTDHHERYPDTDDRVLTCQGPSVDALAEVAVQIVSKVAECAQQTPSDAVGEVGQLRLRTLMPKAAVGGIIGRGGAAIKQLREASGAKVNIADPNGQGPGAEQVISLAGSEEALEFCLAEINRQVQAVSEEPWWLDWAEDNGCHEGGAPKGGKGGKGGKGDIGGKSKGKDKGKEKGKGKDRGRDWDQLEEDRASSYIGGGGRPPRGGFGADHPGARLMIDTVRNLPEHVLEDERGFALSCIVPNRLVGGLIGRAGSGTKDVQAATGTKVGIREIPGDPENRTLNIAGPLGGACAAYMLMMKRYLDAEAESLGGGRGGRR